jgi:uncharacterized protein (TIGR03067 family)
MLQFVRCFVLVLSGLVAAGCTTGAQPSAKQADTSHDEKAARGTGAVNEAHLTDQEAIQGTWVVVSNDENGVPVVGIKGARHTFTAEEITMAEEGPKATYKLDPAKNPKEILICIKVGAIDTFAKGIYQLDGDNLKICWSGRSAEEPAPKDFTSEVGSRRRLTVYNRLKP